MLKPPFDYYRDLKQDVNLLIQVVELVIQRLRERYGVVRLYVNAYEMREAETPGTRAYDFYDAIFGLIMAWPASLADPSLVVNIDAAVVLEEIAAEAVAGN